MSHESTKYRRDLRRIFTEHFTLAEIRILSNDLGVSWGELRGETQPEKIQALIQYLGMRGQLQELIDLGKEERINVVWPEIADPDQPIKDQKADLSEEKRRAIFDNLMDKIGPLTSGVNQIKSLVEADIGNLNTKQTGIVVRSLATANLASFIKLQSISLEKEDLQNSNLGSIQADLSGANLFGANLRGANLTEAILSGANLSGANLIEANLRKADLIEADLSGANLSGANLCEAMLIEADLRGAELNGAILIEAILRGANLTEAILYGAKLTGANLYGANLIEADLREAILIEADLSEAQYDERTKWPEGFDPTQRDMIFIDDPLP